MLNWSHLLRKRRQRSVQQTWTRVWEGSKYLEVQNPVSHVPDFRRYAIFCRTTTFGVTFDTDDEPATRTNNYCLLVQCLLAPLYDASMQNATETFSSSQDFIQAGTEAAEYAKICICEL